MKNKGLWIAGGVLLLLAFPVVVIAANRRRGKDKPGAGKKSSVVADDPIKQTREQFEKDRVDATKAIPVLPTSIAIPAIGGFTLPNLNFLLQWNDYTVKTASGNLNVRERPDSSSKIVDRLPKGSTIKAKASGTRGWMAVSRDGVSTIGYASLEYLQFKTPNK